jgi:hypothetical protein
MLAQADEIEQILCAKFMRFLMMRAENFIILRRKPVPVWGGQVQEIWHYCSHLITRRLCCAAGLRHQFPSHELPHGNDVQAQAG